MTYHTPEGLDNNYVLKLIKRALLKEYNYIKDVKIDYNDIEKYRTIFLNLYVNPIEMSEYYNVPLMKYVHGYLKRGEQLDAVSPSVILDMSYEDGRDILDEMGEIIRGICNSPAIPNELKNLGKRIFGIGGFKAIPE
jgi:hypothetical protein